MVEGRRTPTLGNDLKAARERRGLSIRQAADQAGVSREALSAIERGKRYPALHTLELLAEALEIRITIDPHETTVEHQS